MFRRTQQEPTHEALLIGTLDSPSPIPASNSPSVATMLVPELQLKSWISRLGWRRVTLIVIGASIFIALLAVAITFLNGKDKKGATRGSTAFASALVHDDPGAAKGDAGAFVSGVRAYFGPITSAKLIGIHDHHVNTGDSADTRTYQVTQMLLTTRRGLAVIELSFDDNSIGGDTVTGVRELKPSKAPRVPSAKQRLLEANFAARGGEPAPQEALTSAPASPVVHIKPAKPAPLQHSRAGHPSHRHAPAGVADSQLRKATKALSCVQAAHGNVAELQKCTAP